MAFASAKTTDAIPVRSKPVWTALVQATLDPRVHLILPPIPHTDDPSSLAACDFRLLRGDGEIHVSVGAGRDGEPGSTGAPAAATLSLSVQDLEAEPLSSNAKQVWACGGRLPDVGDQVRLLEFLAEEGCVSLADAAGIVTRSSDGVGNVLALVCRDLIEAWLFDEALGPDTRVSRRVKR